MDKDTVRMTPAVANAINEELAYQESMQSPNCRADQDDHGLPGQILTLEEYVTKLRSAWVGTAGNEGGLDTLRKVAAIAVRGLVRFGCPRRGDDHMTDIEVRKARIMQVFSDFMDFRASQGVDAMFAVRDGLDDWLDELNGEGVFGDAGRYDPRGDAANSSSKPRV